MAFLLTKHIKDSTIAHHWLLSDWAWVVGAMDGQLSRAGVDYQSLKYYFVINWTTIECYSFGLSIYTQNIVCPGVEVPQNGTMAQINPKIIPCSLLLDCVPSLLVHISYTVSVVFKVAMLIRI